MKTALKALGLAALALLGVIVLLNIDLSDRTVAILFALALAWYFNARIDAVHKDILNRLDRLSDHQ